MPTILPTQAFARMDESPDAEFYTIPRLVTHIDDQTIAEVTQLYREHFPVDGSGRILDLMSSWISHLPSEIPYAHVAGLGMNAEELAANPRLTEWRVQDLNADPRLPYADHAFDGCGICVSVQYLTRPIEVLREVGRVLAPGAPVLITFSNRCFPTKAVAVWRMLGDAAHLQLVGHYLEEAGVFTRVLLLDRSPGRGHDPLYAAVGFRQQENNEN